MFIKKHKRASFFIALSMCLVSNVNAAYQDNTGNYSSEQPYNLNVVYFIPNDLKPLPNHQKRISEILLAAKQFIKNGMQAKGFPNNELGLMTDKDNQVKITIIQGQRPHTSYTYDDSDTSDSPIAREIDTYFKQHPSEKLSEHVLILTPNALKPDDNLVWASPFYGLGRYCYALDYVQMEQKTLGMKGRWGDLATQWIGGMIHELGHGLNNSHDATPKSEFARAGESLMSAGNSTYGNSPTYITSATAAVFNTSQVFQKQRVPDQYQPAQINVRDVSITTSKDVVNFKGVFSADKPIDSLVAFIDPSGREDYNRVGWVNHFSTGAQSGAFEFSMPLTDLENRKGDANLALFAYFKNGTEVKAFNYDFKFVNNQAVIQYEAPKSRLADNWRVMAYSSKDDRTTSSAPIDGDVHTAWRSNWDNFPDHPHSLVIDTAQSQTIKGISITNALDADGGTEGVVKNFQVFTSDDGYSWHLAGTFVNHNKTTSPSKFTFANPTTARYIKLVTQSNWDTEYFIFVGMAEVGIF